MPDNKTAAQNDNQEQRDLKDKLDTTKGYQASEQIDVDEIEIPEPSSGVQPAESDTTQSSSNNSE